MARFTKGLDLYDRQRALFDAIPHNAREAFRTLPEGAKEDLHTLTDGRIPSSELRAMGSPYAKGAVEAVPRGASKSYVRRKGLRSARGLAPLLPINKQSGRLQESIAEWDRSNERVLAVAVGFDAAKAGRSMFAVLPTGTRYVVARGLLTALAKNDRIRLRAFRDAYLRGVGEAASQP